MNNFMLSMSVFMNKSQHKRDHNIIHIYNNVKLDWQYYSEYYSYSAILLSIKQKLPLTIQHDIMLHNSLVVLCGIKYDEQNTTFCS